MWFPGSNNENALKSIYIFIFVSYILLEFLKYDFTDYTYKYIIQNEIVLYLSYTNYYRLNF